MSGAYLRRVVAALVVLVAAGLPAAAEPNYPDFSAPVVDAAHVLSDADKAVITRKLFDLQLKTGAQFAVATVPSLDGEEIEPYANKLFRKWKIGQKGVNNGLLLILAPAERKLRFEVGYGLEGTMTDAQSKLILRNDMVPKLKAGDPAGALKAGVDDAIAVLTKDKASLPARLQPQPDMDTTTAIFIALFVFVFVLIFVISIVRQARRGGWSSGWTSGAGGFIAGSSFSGDSGGSSSGGDSFSGGGGGDSGGGGSSDSY